MPRLFAAAIAGGLLFTAFAVPVRPQTEHGRLLRVMTLNIHAGVNARGAYDLPRLAQAIAAAHPDIVGLQEVTRNHVVYQCEDQPKRLASLLHDATGRD